MENQNGEEIYQKVGALLEEREKLYQERERNLSAYREELGEMEKSLDRWKRKLKEVEKRLEETKKELEAEKEQIYAERTAIREEWQALSVKKQELEKDMEQVLTEKAKLQGLKNEWLRLENERELFEMKQTKTGLCLRYGEGEQQEEEPEMPAGSMKEADKSSAKGNDLMAAKKEMYTAAKVDAGEDAAEKKIPKVLQGIAAEAAKSFPEGKDAETALESFRIRVRDKELCFCMGQPFMAEIRTRREKSRFLLNGIKQFNRQQSEWEFSYEDGYLKCTMPFTEAVRPETVVRKCKEAMEHFFAG